MEDVRLFHDTSECPLHLLMNSILWRNASFGLHTTKIFVNNIFKCNFIHNEYWLINTNTVILLQFFYKIKIYILTYFICFVYINYCNRSSICFWIQKYAYELMILLAMRLRDWRSFLLGIVFLLHQENQ